jgi:glutamine synthetase type III
MDSMRAAADALEDLCTAEEWNLPSYMDMLFIQCP